MNASGWWASVLHLKKSFGTVTLPDVGIELLVHQPFSYSHNEFTERLQH